VQIKILTVILWPLYALTLFISVTLIAWHLLAQFDFAYPQAYQLLEIDKHIERYAPQNRYRSQFELTSQAERFELFSEIITSIQNHGKGLADITYSHAGKSSTLLREAEVTHLQRVANVVNQFYWLGITSMVVSLILFVLIRRFKLPYLKFKHVFAGIAFLTLSVIATLFVVGPKTSFHWLHAQVFPAGDQWFFYYQDSLMTTLLKAPDLFGFMGALLAIVSLLLYSCLLYISLKIFTDDIARGVRKGQT
jgi:hypothetical protein